ncbi:hypothetical protein SS50377_24788 [Spironucleus salmonicida]|uniref:MORN repeat-containing protein n=1 Tax=Spironucleus salmonicida TaxID=348837 RepID=V6LV71_9EUKA|nr:hypothetical protein SS50377_24788 [Spironucleus salmonicida]|eukprot:EST44674.1 hypothetical protein SS50377_15451 [Spironucleus salmonicida]
MSFPEVQSTPATITQICYPDTTFIQGNINQSGDGPCTVQFNSGTLFHGALRNFQLSSNLSIMESGPSIILSQFNPLPQGQSLIAFSDGSIFQGNVENGYAVGFGSAYQATSEIYYSGNFQSGMADGFGCAVQGDFKDQNNIESVYLGWFQDGEPHGRGISLGIDGEGLTMFNRFEGYFIQGIRNGSGTIVLGSGEWLIGQFINDEKDGVFLYISEQGEIELRYYFKDIMKLSYKSENYYIDKPQELKFVVMQNEDSKIELYNEYVAYFKFLESTNLPGKSSQSQRIHIIPIIDTIWRFCRRITIPLRVGLITDSRVCTPIISEQIAEIARNLTKLDVCQVLKQTQQSQEMINFFKVVESIKSCIIGNYEILKFLFQFFRARDLITFGEQAKSVYINQFLEEVEKYIEDERIKMVKEDIILPQQNQIQTENSLIDNIHSGENSMEWKDTTKVEETDANQTITLDLNHETIENIVDLVEDAPQAGKMDKIKSLLKVSQILPLSNSGKDNELINTVISLLDQNLVVSHQNIKQMVFDIAAFTEQLDLIQPQDEFIDLLIDQFSKQSDSYQTTIQFDIQTLFSQSITDSNFTQFIAFLLNLYQVFDHDNPIVFMTEVIYPYVKHNLSKLIKALETDNFALSLLFDPTDQFYIDIMKQKSQSKKRRTDLDDDSQSTISKQFSSNSKASKFMSSTGSKAAVPKILLRDASNMLNEQEQSIFRCQKLSGKLVKLMQINQEYQSKFVFPYLINETLETIINNKFGLSISQYLQLDQLTLTEFLFNYFEQFNEVFGFPKISEEIDFYFRVLGPFFVKFARADGSWFLEENTYISDKGQYLIEKILSFHVNQQVLTAILACCLLKTDKINKQKPVVDPNDTTGDLDNNSVVSENSNDSNMDSINSFNSFAESGHSTRSQAEQKKVEGEKQKLFQVDSKKFDEGNCYNVIGLFLQGILQLFNK